MSTRCQVEVYTVGEGITEDVMLYHHTDGYPTHMIPLLQKAYELCVRTTENRYARFGAKPPSYWEMARAGKVAGAICAADPLVFEPESSLDLHGDIEWLYKLRLLPPSGKNPPCWALSVFTPTKGFWREDFTTDPAAMRCELDTINFMQLTLADLDRIEENAAKE